MGRRSTVAALVLVAATGAVLGVLYPSKKLPEPWGSLQSALGWTYSAAWGLSFYPQVRGTYTQSEWIGRRLLADGDHGGPRRARQRRWRPPPHHIVGAVCCAPNSRRFGLQVLLNARRRSVSGL